MLWLLFSVAICWKKKPKCSFSSFYSNVLFANRPKVIKYFGCFVIKLVIKNFTKNPNLITLLSVFSVMFTTLPVGNFNHRQLVRSIPRLSASSCHVLGKRNAMGTFFYARHIQNGWPWWKSQMSCREECSHSIDFVQYIAGWCWDSRDGEH